MDLHWDGQTGDRRCFTIKGDIGGFETVETFRPDSIGCQNIEAADLTSSGRYFHFAVNRR